MKDKIIVKGDIGGNLLIQKMKGKNKYWVQIRYEEDGEAESVSTIAIDGDCLSQIAEWCIEQGV